MNDEEYIEQFISEAQRRFSTTGIYEVLESVARITPTVLTKEVTALHSVQNVTLDARVMFDLGADSLDVQGVGFAYEQSLDRKFMRSIVNPFDEPLPPDGITVFKKDQTFTTEIIDYYTAQGVAKPFWYCMGEEDKRRIIDGKEGLQFYRSRITVGGLMLRITQLAHPDNRILNP